LVQPHKLLKGDLARNGASGLGVVLLLFGYLIDMKDWRVLRVSGPLKSVAVLYSTVAGALFFVALLFHTAQMPSIPFFVCVAASLIGVTYLRRKVFKGTPVQVFSFAESIAFALVAAFAGVIWFLWAFTRMGDHSAWGEETIKTFADATPHYKEIEFILWCSPALLSFMYLLVALVCWSRSWIHSRESGEEDTFVSAELKVICVAVGILAFITWLGVSLAVQSVDVSNIVIRFSAFMFLCLGLYVVSEIGIEKLEEAAVKDATVQAAIDFALSDWVKGAFALVALPLAPFLFALDAVHQCFRKCSRASSGCLTTEAYALLAWISKWNWASVLTKSMCCGLGAFLTKALVSHGLVVFLAWFNEYLEPWSVGSSLSLLFVVELILFLFPPVAGIPLYMIAGIVVIPKVRKLGYGVFAGIIAGTVYSFVLKMVAIAMEQKLIGQPLSRNIATKKFVGVQTPGMKAIRYILSQKGFHANQIAVLVGGPDWPTSVLTGILNLSLGAMLMRSIPLIVLIFPAVVASAYTISEAEDAASMSQNKAIAGVALALAAVFQGGASVLAAYYVQEATVDHKDEVDAMVDPQEAEVLESVEQDRITAKAWAKATGWSASPVWVRVVLVLGSLLASATVAVTMNPSNKAFTDFALTEKVSRLPGGVITLINAPGWVAIYLSIAVGVCLLVWGIWAKGAFGKKGMLIQPLQ